MRGRELHWILPLGTVLLCLGCGAGSSAYRAGRKAELHKDYDTALVHYERAVQSQPGNAELLLHEKFVRTQASLFHLKQGKAFLEGGRLDEAAGEFQKAVSIDPSNQAAAQELARVLTQQAAAKRAREDVLQQALKARDEAHGPIGPPRLKPFPAEPLAHFKITADSRKVYETLGQLAGLNVAFTADFQPRPVSLNLSQVKIDEALSILSFQTKTFWKPVTENTILVVPDNPTNRRDYQEEVLKTVYLTNPLAPADRTAITTALKQVLGLQRIIDNPDSNAIIIRDTPAKVAAAEKMIRDLDRGKAEILLQVTILEADRNRVRDLGLTQVATSPLPGTAVAGVGFNPSTTVTSGDSQIPALPLNRLGRISTRDFSIVLPGAIANALLNDARTRILQNPQVRVTDGQTAKLNVGSRIPYATGSFLPSLGGVSSGAGFGLLASTQFQYQDVGVNVDITPRLLPTGEVSLKAKIEISSLQAAISIGGFTQPTFGQRKIEHDIRLKEGEVNLLGGLIETKESETVSGLPGLGQIPFLRYLFSTEKRERVDTEVLVMLTPQVIRLPEPAGDMREVQVGGDGRGPGPVPTPELAPPAQEPPAEQPGPQQ
jgi:general secretion pathway protein D